MNLRVYDPEVEGKSKVSYKPSLDDSVTLGQRLLVPKLETATCNSRGTARG